MLHTTEAVIRFPIERRVNRSARDAITNLARARLVSEQEAVQAVRGLGATDEEIDVLRAIYAARRNRI